VRFCNGKDEASKSEIHYDGDETEPVASFSPNSLGLYDMSGNVYEWTCSEYEKRYDGSEERCSDRAYDYSLRGGSWGDRPRWVRAASRYDLNPDYRGDFIGFRLARDN